MITESNGSPTQEQRLEQVLAAYLRDLEAGRDPDRDEILARHPDLAGELQDFFSAHQQLGRLAEPLRQVVQPNAEPQQTTDSAGEIAGTTIAGRYKLLEPIGHGGMGQVWMADQRIPVKRLVALKLIKAGMDSRAVLTRFEAERQALALMDHANIARVFDGGTTDAGRPYFVMELVKGLPLTTYCDERRLSVPERLELFVQVCSAVQHAHQKGIMHRDLKPSNILVTEYDGRPVPKVIDFGLAKALTTTSVLTEHTLHTAFGTMVGTPLYMAPEQVGINALDVDTRTDVYSLGVLLYELLTGTTPFDRETLKKASYDELRRIIREDEPPRPSTRLSTIEQAVLSTIAERREQEPRRLSQQMRGELDWIVMKALEKERSRRYESASAFAADLRRYLDDEPVQACPPSVGYRLRKFARRNRGRLAANAFLLLSGLVFACLLISFHLQSVGRLRQVSQGVQEALAGARTAIEAGNLTLANQRIAEAQGRLGADADKLQELAAEVEGVQQEIAAREADESRFQRFRKLAAEVENSASIRLGDQGDLGPWAEEALGVYGVLTDENWIAALDTSYLTAAQKQQVREAAYAVLLCLADYRVRWIGKWGMSPEASAEAAARTLELLRRTEAFHQPTRAFYFIRSQCHEVQGTTAAAEEDRKRYKATAGITAWDYYFPGHTAGWNGDVEEAKRSYLAALRVQPDHYNSLYFLAKREMENPKINRLSEAVQLLTACIALRPDFTNLWLDRVRCYRKLGKLEEAEADLIESIKRTKSRLENEKSRLGPDHPDTFRTTYDLAQVYQEAGRLPEAIAQYREAIRINKDNAGVHNNLGNALRDKGQLDDAIAEYREALRLKKDFAEAHNNLGNALGDKGQLDEAIAEYREAIRLNKDDAGVHSNLGNALRERGQLDEAIAECREAIRLKKDFAGAHYHFGLLHESKGQLDEAIAEYREAIRLQKDFAEPHCNLGALLEEMGQFAEALIYRRRGHELGSKNPRWRYPSARWVKNCERLVELDGKLPAILSGEKQPADVAERLAVAQLCAMLCKKHYPDAVRFFREAFKEDPKLADDMDAQHRYNAACAAALAGCGQGQHADKLDGKEQARLRQQALDWLRADLKAYGQQMEKPAGKAGPAVGPRMQHWLRDLDFSGVRGENALAKLPEKERDAWRQLWADVAQMLAKTQGKAPVRKKPDPK